MTIDEFREIALSLPETEERSHMGHPDFRVKAKIFASLGYPKEGFGMVKLKPDQQRVYVQADPKAFSLANGAWGLKGSTIVLIQAANAEMVREALTEAWLGTAPKLLAERFSKGRS